MNYEPFLDKEAIEKLKIEELSSDKQQKRTSEQIEAIYSSGQNILISASAGSGKTFVMVERIMDMIKRGVSIDRLFISTFTVKAAGELKDRLRTKLQTAIKEETSPQEKNRLNDQINAISLADIGTMDAFTQKLVNQYGYLIGVSPQFRILQDVTEQDIFKNTIFTELFESYLNGKDAKLFRQLVRNFSGNRKDNYAFKQLVYAIYQFSQSTENPKEWLETTFLKASLDLQSFDAISNQRINQFLEIMHQTADSLKDLTDLEEYPRFKKDGKPTKKYTQHLALIEKLHESALHFETDYGKEKLSQLAKELAALLPSGTDITIAKVSYSVFKAIQNEIQYFRHLETIFQYQPETILLLELLQSFVLTFSQQYLALKKEENCFEFGDIAHFAIQILEENQVIRQTFQEKYHEVMVDEYQDNNHTQERLLELLSNGHNRFMVGDIKQSIYRFRQADPAIFNAKFQDYLNHPQHGKLIILKENFRSQNEVISVTNQVFKHLMDVQIGDIDYDDNHSLKAGSERQLIAKPENKAQILLYDNSLQDNSEYKEESANPIDPGEVKIIAKEIIRLHNHENVAFNEITLLVSSRTRNDSIIRLFNQYGIPLAADGGEQNYLQSVEVMVMLETLRTIDNPLNDYALIALLRSPMFFFDEDDLARISLQGKKDKKKENFYEKLKNAKAHSGEHPELITADLSQKIVTFETYLDKWRTLSRNTALYELIWTIYNDRFYFDYVGDSPKAEQAQANLYALALRANQFEKNGFRGLSRFINMIDHIIETENDLASVEAVVPKDAVSLMTIHKSKGLEFPYVFILNIDKKFSFTDVNAQAILSRKNGIGIKYTADFKEALQETILPSVPVVLETLPYQVNRAELKLATLSEQMRLLYVAMTRAEKKLYLVGKANQDKWETKFQMESENQKIPLIERQSMSSFMEWLLAIDHIFKDTKEYMEITYISDHELSDDKIGQLKQTDKIRANVVLKERQSQEIVDALKRLEAVQILNKQYEPAINQPAVRTPCQVKKLYEPVQDTEGVDIEKDSYSKSRQFELPSLDKRLDIKATQIGSSIHELMQRLPLEAEITESVIEKTIDEMLLPTELRRQIDSKMIFDFFNHTKLGQLMLSYPENLFREAPFAMLKKDDISHEDYVIRGIIDGYFVFENQLILFDYKTDHYKNTLDVVKRYKGQMSLYAESLLKAYPNREIKSFLILLGGKQVEVVEVNN